MDVSGIRRLAGGSLDSPDEQRQRRSDVLWLDEQAMMIRAESAGYHVGILPFVVVLVLVTHRIGPDVTWRHLVHERRDDRRVQTPAEEHSDRHVRDHSVLDRFLQRVADSLDPFLLARFRYRRQVRHRRLPVLVDADLPVLNIDEAARRKIVNPLEHRSWVHGHEEREELIDAAIVNVASHVGVQEDRLDLRPEDEGVPCDGVEEGLLPNAITRKNEPFLPGVPQSDRELSIQPVYKIESQI